MTGTAFWVIMGMGMGTNMGGSKDLWSISLIFMVFDTSCYESCIVDTVQIH